jgi:predicted type IV restriction endonuclease
MSQITAITKALTNLNEAHRKFNIFPTTDPEFFPEWQIDLPVLTDAEKQTCDRLKNRYLYYAADGAISEGTIHYMMLSPLLELLNLYDPPYKVRAEKTVYVELTTEDTILEGRIDALVLQDQLWVVLIEAKQYGFSVLQAVPQTLAYMMANPNSDKPAFGLITTGEDYLFLKLHARQYAQSYKFTLLSDERNNLLRVLQVLKHLVEVV